MLFRLLLFTVLAYYIFRAIGNLIKAVRGEVGNSASNPRFRNYDGEPYTSDPEQPVVTTRNNQPPASAEPRNVEDAKWTDVS